MQEFECGKDQSILEVEEKEWQESSHTQEILIRKYREKLRRRLFLNLLQQLGVMR